jgi:hypothetical protein
MRRLLLLPVLFLLVRCVGPTDDSTQVHDLRVLAATFDPPEIMSPDCTNQQITTFFFLQPIKMKFLIADPKGDGRDIDYTVSACANVNDHKCEDEGDFATLDAGTTQAGEFNFKATLATIILDPDGGSPTPLLQETISQDLYKGLGGVRVPVNLHLTAGDEQVYAQKLMVYSCKFFADQKANVNPVLPGMNLDGQPWDEGVTRTLSGNAPFVMEPPDFSDREEDYIVPSFSLDPINLHEAWKISWHATLGKFSSTETGGVDFSGEGEKHRNEWAPRTEDVIAGQEQDVTFTFVARDGRGGIGWIQRTAHWIPEGK